MDRPESEQGERAHAETSESPNTSPRHHDENGGESKEVPDDGCDSQHVNSSWAHDQKVSPSPALKDFLTSLKSGLETMINMEKAKLAEYSKAKNQMGGR